MIPLMPDNVRLLSFLASKTPAASSPCFHLPVIRRPPIPAWQMCSQPRAASQPHALSASWLAPSLGENQRVTRRRPACSQPRRVSRASLPPTPPPPRPRFRPPSLHLSLLRSPTWSMCIRYMLHPFFVFGHLLVRTYFDFNIVMFILVQCVSPPLCSLFLLTQHSVSSCPSQSNSARNWSLAVAAYIACFQLIGVFVAYELVYSFWRRWSVNEYCPHYFRFHVSLLTYVHASTLVQAFLDHCTYASQMHCMSMLENIVDWTQNISHPCRRGGRYTFILMVQVRVVLMPFYRTSPYPSHVPLLACPQPCCTYILHTFLLLRVHTPVCTPAMALFRLLSQIFDFLAHVPIGDFPTTISC